MASIKKLQRKQTIHVQGCVNYSALLYKGHKPKITRRYYGKK